MNLRATLPLAVVLAIFLSVPAVSAGALPAEDPLQQVTQVLSVPAASAKARPSEGRLEQKARAKINAARARNGVRRLRMSRALTRSAGNYARWMLRSGYFGHQSSIWAPRRYRSLGEIILIHPGRHGRPGVAVRHWAQSSAHRYIMLSSRYGLVGVGKASGRFRGRRATVWVAHVGRR
jgi:uncharacterized protein YkwD